MRRVYLNYMDGNRDTKVNGRKDSTNDGTNLVNCPLSES